MSDFNDVNPPTAKNGVVILNEFEKSVDTGKPLSNYGGKPHGSS
jgi:hypothetical protein